MSNYKFRVKENMSLCRKWMSIWSRSKTYYERVLEQEPLISAYSVGKTKGVYYFFKNESDLLLFKIKYSDCDLTYD